MAYQIRYGESKYDQQHQNRTTKKWILWIIAVIFALGLLQMNDDAAWQWLLPGDPAVTAAAFSHLQEDLQDGQQLAAALTAFCREIVDGAALAQ